MNKVKEQSAANGKNFLMAILGNLLPPVVSIVTAPILASSLGVEGRGEVAAATAPLMLALAVSAFGIPEATVNKIARYPESYQNIIKNSIILIIIAGALGTCGVIFSSGYLSGGNAETQHLIILATTALLPSLVIAVLRSAAMGLHLWKAVTLSRIFDAVIRLVSVALLAVTGELSIISAMAVISFSPVVSGILLIPYLKNEKLTLERRRRKITKLSLIDFGLRLWVGGLSGVVLTRISQVLMVPLATSYDLGLYVVAVSLAEVPLVVNSAVREVIFSSESAESADERVGLASRLSTGATICIALVIGLTQGYWLEPLFGEGFAEAANILLVLLAATVLGNPGSVAGAALSGRGRPGLRSISLFVAATVNLLLVITLVPAMGAIGAAWATMVGNLIASNMNIIFLKTKFNLSPLLFYGFRPISDGRIMLGFIKKIIIRN